MPLPTAPPPIAQVGDYALVRRIGSGGMGEVWLGRHVLSGSLGAIKRLSPHAVLRSPLATYFEREGRAVARLAHPHVVPVYEVGDDYLISAYVEGGNLARRLHTPIEPAEALRVARQVADALAHAHERGVIHRDVKPSNILVDGHGNAYLADFGLAAFVGEAEDPARRAGTPQFMAPEQRRGLLVGPAADQYALGRTLLEMLVGSGVPLDPAAALAELPTYLPPALRAAITRATDETPEARFPSMAAFAAALAVDLGAFGPPQRLAPATRGATSFAWVAGAHRVVSIGPDLDRADYRLRDLAAAGLLRPERVAAHLRQTGLADVGFSAWMSTARLGAATDPMSLARASDIVVLLHGWGGTRDGWASIAAGICRDNARAVVLAPDLHGFGESPFAGLPTMAQASALGLARAIDDWRRLLGLAEIPTALVGYSMAGLALLVIDDADAGQHVSRIALNPILASHDPLMKKRLRGMALVASTLGRIGPLRRLGVRLGTRRNPQAAAMTDESLAAVFEQLDRMPGRVMGRILEAIAETPSQMGRHRRAAVIVSLDDPWMNFASLDDVIAEVGIEPAQVHRLANGGHNPYTESRDYPGRSARNLVDIVRIIDSMLMTASQPSLGSPSLAATTVAAGSSTEGQ